MSRKRTNKEIEALRDALDKQFGKGVVFQMGGGSVEPIEVISTGSLGLDIALGCGGLPRGRVIEAFGQESSGKTTMTLHAIAEAQRMGGICAFVDAEHALDMNYAQALGVKLDDLMVSQPDCGEQALEIVDVMVRSGTIALIVVDSVAALTPRAELEGEMGDAHMGLQARLMSQALRKLTAVCHKTGTAVVFINQLRQKIGVVYGNPWTTSGGNALKFYASIRLEVKRTKTLKDKDGGANASTTVVKVVKNKCAPPFKEAEFTVRYGLGIDRLAELVTLGERYAVLEKSGSWYSFNGERVGQGRAAVEQSFSDDATLAASVREQILAAVAAGRAAINGGEAEATPGISVDE